MNPGNSVDNVRIALRCLEVIRDQEYAAKGEGDSTVWHWLGTYASGKHWPSGRPVVLGPGGFRPLFEELLALRSELRGS